MPGPQNKFEAYGDSYIENQNTENMDEKAYAGLNSAYQQKLQDIAYYNPKIGNDPQALQTIASQEGVNAKTLAHAANFLTYYGGSAKDITTQANSLSHGMGFWNSVKQVADGLYRGVMNSLTPGTPATPLGAFGPNKKAVASDEQFASGAVQGTGQLVTGAINTVNRTLLTGEEYLQGAAEYAIGMHGYKQQFDTANQTLNNFGQSTNPMNLFSIMGHSGAYLQSVANRKGWSYVEGNLAPLIASSAFGGEFVGAADETTSIAEAEKTVSAYNDAIKAGKELTTDDTTKATAAQKFLDSVSRRGETTEQFDTDLENINRETDELTNVKELSKGEKSAYKRLANRIDQLEKQLNHIEEGDDEEALKEDLKKAQAKMDVYRRRLSMLENRDTLLKTYQDAKYKLLKERQDSGILSDAERTDIARTNEEARIKSMRSLRAKTDKFFTTLTESTVGTPLSAIRAIKGTITPAHMTAFYASLAVQAQANAQDRELWELSKNGVVNKYGKTEGSFGQAVARDLGLGVGNAFYSPLSGAIDAYSNYVAYDPLAVVGHISSVVRSEYGFAGVLRNVLGDGLGIRSGEDVFLKSGNSMRTLRAFEFMAEHSAERINAAFPGLFTGDGGKELLKAVARAETPNQVMGAFAEAVDAGDFTKRMLPTLSLWKVTKAGLFRDVVLERFDLTRGFVGDALNQDYQVLLKISERLKDKLGIDTMPTDAYEAAVADPRMRAIAATRRGISDDSKLYRFERWLSRMFTQRPMAWDEESLRYVNRKIIPGSLDGVNAIQNLLRIRGESELFVQTVGDALIHTENPDDWFTVLEHVDLAKMDEAIIAHIPNSLHNILLDPVREAVGEKIREFWGLNRGGNEGIYVQGADGPRYSRVVDPNDPNFARYFAISQDQLGSMKLYDTRRYKNYQKEMFALLASQSSRAAGSIDNLARLNQTTLETLGIFNKTTLADVAKNVEDRSFIRDLMERFPGLTPYKALRPIGPQKDWEIEELYHEAFPQAYLKAYDETLVELRNKMGELSSDKVSSSTQAWAQAVDHVRTRIYRLNEAMEQSQQDIFDQGEWKTYIPTESDMRADAELQALTEYQTELLSQVNTGSITDIDINRAVMQYEKRLAPEQQKLQQKLIEDYRAKLNGIARQTGKGAYLNRSQRMVDALNRFMSQTFVPMALFSGGWSLRVAMSEFMLNSMRFSDGELIRSKLMTSIAQHELRGIPLREGEEMAEKLGSEYVKSSTIYAQSYGDGRLVTRERDAIASAVGHQFDFVMNVIKNPLSGVRDVFAGALMGIERGILNGMTKDQELRFLDDTVGLFMRHGGWRQGENMPGSVHETEDYFSPEAFSRKSAQATYGVENGKYVRGEAFRDHTFQRVDGANMATALHEIFHTAQPDIGLFKSDVMKDISDEIATNGVEYTPKELELLKERLERKALNRLENVYTEKQLERMSRKDYELWDPDLKTGRGAKADYARTLVADGLGTVQGVRDGKYLLHAPFVDMITSGDIPSASKIAEMLVRMGDSAPKDIYAPGFINENPLGKLSSGTFLNDISSLGHEKVFGPIVNSLVRKPIFALEHHLAMESGIRDLVQQGLIDLDQAEVMADNEALRNMKKYVHNPMERTNFEANVRVAAPFYFAQNQAWRRAFRVLEEDPGAFERYLKACLAVTNYVAINTQNGTIPSINIPGSQYVMGAAAWGGTQMFGFNDAEQSMFKNLGFGLSMDESSVQSVIPTGGQIGAGMLGDLFRPSWGPLVTVPIKLVGKLFENYPDYNKYATIFLGNTSAQSGFFSDLLPSTAVRDAIGVVGGLTGLGETSSILSIESEVLNSALDNARENLWKQYSNDYNWDGFSQAKKEAYLHGYVDMAMTKLLKTKQWDVEMAKARGAAIAMYVAKAAIGFGAPAALSVQAQFSKDPEFQTIMQSIDPSTGHKYTFIAATDKWSREFPYALIDMVSKRQGPAFAETNSFINMWNENPAAVRDFPNFMAYMITQNSAYNPGAHSIMIGSGLDTQDTPEEYREAMQTAIGNDMYYNYVEPAYYKAYGHWFGPGSSKNEISYQGYKELKNYANWYGRNYNNTWYDNSSFGVNKAYTETQAINEMNEFLSDTKNEKIFGSETFSTLKSLAQYYNEYAAATTSALLSGNSKKAYELETSWYAYCQELANDPTYASLSYFITSVLSKLPNK